MTNEDDIDPKAAEAQKAKDLIIRGHLEDADEKEILSEVQCIDFYFRKMDSYDLEQLLCSFEVSSVMESRQTAGQVLAAYFDWCFRSGMKLVPRSSKKLGLEAFTAFRTDKFRAQYHGDALWEPVEPYLARYAQIAVTRMVGALDELIYQREYNRLPSWVKPDAVFVWVRPRGRPSGTDTTWDMAIYAYVELLWRKGTRVTIAKQRAARKFGCSVSKVEKTLKKQARPYFSRKLKWDPSDFSGER